MASYASYSVNPRVFGAAIAYFQQGYSVIPLLGDRDFARSKQASVAWRDYQNHIPSPEILKNWFLGDGYSALGIVTGRISSLLVIDFDDETILRQFQNQFPELINTHIVRSAGRAMPHYYYQTPKGFAVTSHHYDGVDILGDGCYVVAPPTSINHKPYVVESRANPISLTIAQIAMIQAFFRGLCVTAPQSTEIALNPIIGTTPISVDSAKLMYDQLAPYGRNHALFTTTRHLRDAGWSQSQIEAILVQRHRDRKQTDETPKSRQREAQATIASVFSRPPAKNQPITRKQGLPNSLREKLLQLGHVALLRVLDGIQIANLNCAITERDLLTTLETIGRHSILKALKATYPDGSSIFQTPNQTHENPFPTPHTHTTVATAIAEESNNKCLLFRVTGSNKIPRGRPPKTYVLPSILTLCEKYDVTPQGSDELSIEDLQTERSYRIALQRELVKRRPASYDSKWIATRLGVSKRSIQRYHATSLIRRTFAYDRKPITWSTITHVPDTTTPVFGVFLEDELGNRYPALLPIARKLLAQKHHLTLCRQRANMYSVDPTENALQQAQPDLAPKQNLAQRFAQLFAEHSTPTTATSPVLQPQTTPPISISAQIQPIISSKLTIPDPDAYVPKSRRYYQATLDETSAETWANRLYTRIKASCQTANGYLSLAWARRLTEQFGHDLVKQLLRQLAWRTDIENPAGFAVAWLRSEAKTAFLQSLAT